MTVLVLDDNLLSRTAILNQLRRSGHAPELASNIPEALAAATQHHPHFVLINLAATTFDPLVLIQAFRKDPHLSPCPLVGFCGHLEHARQTSAREAGCHYIITNAQALRQLAATLAMLD